MTKAEENVIQKAFNMTDAIVAGSYDIPKPMVYALNQLQDSVYDLLNERNIGIKDCISPDYKEFRDKYWKKVENILYGRNVGDK